MSIHYATIIDYTAFVIIGWMILDFLWWGRKAFKAHYQDITGYVESLETLARFAEIDRDGAIERADIAEAQYRDYLEYVKRAKETDKIQEQRRREYFATRPIKDWTPEDQTHEWARLVTIRKGGLEDYRDDAPENHHLHRDVNDVAAEREELISHEEMEMAGYPEGTE